MIRHAYFHHDLLPRSRHSFDLFPLLQEQAEAKAMLDEVFAAEHATEIYKCVQCRGSVVTLRPSIDHILEDDGQLRERRAMAHIHLLVNISHSISAHAPSLFH